MQEHLAPDHCGWLRSRHLCPSELLRVNTFVRTVEKGDSFLVCKEYNFSLLCMHTICFFLYLQLRSLQLTLNEIAHSVVRHGADKIMLINMFQCKQSSFLGFSPYFYFLREIKSVIALAFILQR